MELKRQIVCVMAAVFCWLAIASDGPNRRMAWAEEPYERFLEKLKEEQLYDLALAYLDTLQSKPGISADFQAAIDIERAMLLYQAAAILPPTRPERAAKLDEAEAALRRFLQDRPQHSRRGEARLKLGELLMARGEESLRLARERGEESSADAVRFYDEAHQVFEQTVQELAAELEKVKGARVDSKDTAAVERRQQIQQQIRQAQLLSAVAVKERGHGRAPGPEREADLRAAAKMFHDLFQKETRLAGVRYFSLFYRGQVQRELGLNDEAIDAFQRVADLEGVDPLRPLQMQAVKELIEILTAEGKYPLAVERGETWVRKLRPDEQHTAEAIAMRLALYKARLAWADELKKKDPDDRVSSRLVRDTRSDLRSLLRTPGPHVDEVQQLLAKVGVASGGSAIEVEAIPAVKTFAEAYSAAQQRIDAAETESLAAEVLREKGDEEGARAVEEKVNQLRQQAVELLQRALALFGPEDDRDTLFDARYRLAFLKLKLADPFSATAIAEFLARTHPRTERGLRAAALALGGLSDLLRTAGDKEKVALMAHLEPLAEYLVATWPDSTEAAAASAALVQLALINNELDKVERYLQLIPATGESASQLRRDVGLAMYGEYLQRRRRAGEEAPEVVDIRDKALRTLQPAVAWLQSSPPQERNVEALNAYVRLLLASNQVEAAVAVLQDDASPLRLVQQQAEAIEPRVAMDTYRTALQTTIAALSDGLIDADQAIASTQQYIDRLQELAAKADNGAQVLAAIFVQLAKDTSDRLAATTDDQAKQRLAQALLLVAAQAATSDNFNTRYWAVDTVIGLAEELLKQRGQQSLARQSLEQTIAQIQQMLEREKSEPGWIDPPALTIKVRLLLAKAYRLLGDYKEALNQLAAVLEQNPALLDVQMEAARVYQAWGDATAPLAHRAAILGGRPIQPGKNLFWGFGKISQMTAGKEEFEDYFFESRVPARPLAIPVCPQPDRRPTTS
ncbi:MAG: hypothetical protein KatS3mg111_2900 [Pirellulaceae bacterium]|nr:MAG: hypothetical protein KatS3mg111_2900 [Pirellulaceae bacterium]